MRTVTLIILLSVCLFSPINGQSVFTLSAEIEKLQNSLMQNYSDREIQLILIQEYLNNGKPELALMEVLGAERIFKNDLDLLKLKGKAQFNLNQTLAAQHTLRNTYLLKPEDAILFDVGILEYAIGNNSVGKEVLTRLNKRKPSTYNDILYQLQKVNDIKAAIPQAMIAAAKDINPSQFASEFAIPGLIINYPSDNSTIESNLLEIDFEIFHNKDITSIQINENSVYTNPAATSTLSNFRKRIKEKLDLEEGVNRVRLTATDRYQYFTQKDLTIHNINYKRNPQWHSFESDSLRLNFSSILSYVPEIQIQIEKRSENKNLFIVMNQKNKDAYKQNALFFYDLLSNKLTSPVDPNNSKIMLDKAVANENVDAIIDFWFTKNSIGGILNILISGEWFLKEGVCFILDVDGNLINIDELLNKIFNSNCAGINLIIDGSLQNTSQIESHLKTFVSTKNIPFAFIILPDAFDYPAAIREGLKLPELKADSTYEEQISLSTIHKYFSSDYFSYIATIYATDISIQSLINPYGVVLNKHNELLKELEYKMKLSRVSFQNQKKIREFSKDWRSYNEVYRFITDELVLSDFIVRIDEFMGRKGKGGRTR